MEIFVCIVVGVLFFLLSLFGGSGQSESDSQRQLDGLDDGNGAVFVNGEHMTRQEAKDAQSRGELFDSYY